MQGLFIPKSSSLQNFESILLQWIADLHRFSEVMDYEDAIHDHLERANAGILSISAAKSGYIVLPEAYIKRKRQKGEEGSQKEEGGYLDICLFDLLRDATIFLECKWGIVPFKSLIKTATNTLYSAQADASTVIGSPLSPTIAKYESVEKVGVAFICPLFESTDPWQKIESDLQEAISDFKNDSFLDGIAWYFSDRLVNKINRYNGITPGIFLLCKKVSST